MAKRKVCVVTGTRAEYGLLKPLMKAIDKSPRLKLVILATGMHLLKEYGYTISEIRKDFDASKIIRVEMPLKNDSKEEMARYLARGIENFSRAFAKARPDILFVLGDRSEPLAAAIAASYVGVPVAHAQGGDVTGTMIDESIRHAITKFAHIHFPATKRAATRVRKMGENPKHIHVVGTLGLGDVRKGGFLGKKELFAKYGLQPGKKTLLVVQHPVSTESEKAGLQLKQTLEAVEELRLQSLVVYPNCDSGSMDEIRVIRKFSKVGFMRIVKSVPREDFIAFLHHADLLVGNSSAAFLEAPSVKLPAVNIGKRQTGREESENVLDVGQSKAEIKKAIKRALSDKSFIASVKKCKNPHEMKNTEERIIRILEKVGLGKELIQKKFWD